MITPIKKMTSSLLLRSLEFEVCLGWPDEERQQLQKILLDIEFKFYHPPRACSTDDLADTHCYDELIKKIAKHLNKKQFRLIEYLGKELYEYIKSELPLNEAALTIRLTKTPCIPNLQGGVSFCYGDFDETTT